MVPYKELLGCLYFIFYFAERKLVFRICVFLCISKYAFDLAVDKQYKHLNIT